MTRYKGRWLEPLPELLISVSLSLLLVYIPAGLATTKLVDDADQLIQSKDYRKALVILNETLNSGTDNKSQLLALRGQAHLALRNPEQALIDFGDAKNLGNEDTEVIYQLGLGKLFGIGIEQDVNAGIKLLLDQAEAGHHPSQIALVQVYRQHKRNRQAAKWLNQAADEGFDRAALILGREYHAGKFLRKNPYEGVRWYLKAAEAGNAIAQAELGNQYIPHINRADTPVTPNPDRARKWIELSLTQDNFDANHYYARMYEMGYGVEQNHQAATYWYWRAAQQQHLASQIELGRKYLYGEGMVQNFELARYWFEQSTGLDQANNYLGLIHQFGLGVKVDLEKAISYFKKIKNRPNSHNAKIDLLELIHSQDSAALDDYKLQLDEIADPNRMNELAWLLATEAPVRSTYSDLAVKLSGRAVEMAALPALLDTQAAAFASKGDFRKAYRAQKRALKLIKDKSSPMYTILETHMGLYEKKQPVRIRFDDVETDGSFNIPPRTIRFRGLFTKINVSENRQLRGIYLDDRSEANFSLEVLVQEMLEDQLPYDFRDYLLLYLKSPGQLFAQIDEEVATMQFPQGSFEFVLTEDYPGGYTLSFKPVI